MASGLPDRTTSPTSRPLLTGRPRQSPVWQFFEYDNHKGKSICQVLIGDDGVPCGTEISGKFPTNLKAHLKTAHSQVFVEVGVVADMWWVCVVYDICMYLLNWAIQQQLLFLVLAACTTLQQCCFCACVITNGSTWLPTIWWMWMWVVNHLYSPSSLELCSISK